MPLSPKRLHKGPMDIEQGNIGAIYCGTLGSFQQFSVELLCLNSRNNNVILTVSLLTLVPSTFPQGYSVFL
jgi:hypothetical protein